MLYGGAGRLLQTSLRFGFPRWEPILCHSQKPEAHNGRRIQPRAFCKSVCEVFGVLRKMKPVRQVEAAEHMIAGSTYSTLFAKSLLALTKPEFLAQSTRRPKVAATSLAAQEMLGKETEQLVQDLKAIEDSYGRDVLTITVC